MWTFSRWGFGWEWVRRPFSGVGSDVQQTPQWNLFLLVWFVNHRVVPDGPAPPRVPLTQRKTLSAGLLRSELALATGKQDSSLRFGNMQLQKFLSQVMAASKVQFGHSSRPIAIRSGRAIPWTLRGGEYGVNQASPSCLEIMTVTAASVPH